MSARNIYHDAVVQALVADGWTITHDPLTLSFGGKDLFVDLGAERATLAAERSGERIAVEIQSFLSPSPVRDLQEAVGQYEVYRAVLLERIQRGGFSWRCLVGSSRDSSPSGSVSSSFNDWSFGLSFLANSSKGSCNG